MTPSAEIYDEAERGASLKRLPASHQQLAELLSEQLDGLTQAHQRAEAWLLEEAKRIAVTRRLATVPGIGPIRAALLVAVMVTPGRFRTTRQFWSYSGLAIVTRSSSDYARENGRWVRKPTAQTRGLNRNRQPLLKDIFKGAATTVIQHPNHPWPLVRDEQAPLKGYAPSEHLLKPWPTRPHQENGALFFRDIDQAFKSPLASASLVIGCIVPLRATTDDLTRVARHAHRNVLAKPQTDRPMSGPRRKRRRTPLTSPPPGGGGFKRA